jgi:hypothetical protein
VPIFSNNSVDELLDVCLIGHVDGTPHDTGTFRPGDALQVSKFLIMSIRNNHLGPFVQESQTDGATQSPCAAGDQYYVPRESHSFSVIGYYTAPLSDTQSLRMAVSR